MPRPPPPSTNGQKHRANELDERARPPSLCSPCCGDEVQIEASPSPSQPMSGTRGKMGSQCDHLEKLLFKIVEDVNRNMCDVKKLVEEKMQGFDQTLQSQIDRLIDHTLQAQTLQEQFAERAEHAREKQPIPRTISRRSDGSRESLGSSLRPSEVMNEHQRTLQSYAGSTALGELLPISMDFEELSEATNNLFEAVRTSDISLVSRLLEEAGDPNSTVSEYRLKVEDSGRIKTYKPCSLLALAVLEQHCEVAELLIKSNADPDSTYGFSAGAKRLWWTGPCSHATVAKHNLELLDLLVRSRSDPHAISNSGANLLWQCSYFGDSDMLEYLLNLGVSPEPAAEHPDMVGVSHPSLHIATIRGHHSVVASLLAANASHEARNEIGVTALDDAIHECRPSIVALLVAQGANLLGVGNDNDAEQSSTWKKTNYRKKPETRFLRSTSYALRPIDRVFHLENPVVMSAVADGLKHQERQMQSLTLTELVKFLSTPGDTPERILKALFQERTIFYWQQDDTHTVRKDITTAFIPKPRVLPSGALAENMNVASLPMTYNDFESMNTRREPLSTTEIERLFELVPQRRPKGCFKEEYLVTSVILYECLIQDVHKDLLVIATISKLHHKMLGHKPAQAILQHCWTKVITLQVFDVFVHLFMMLDFIAISIILQHPSTDFGMDRNVLIRIIACFGLLCAAIHVFSELLQCVAFELQGWLCDYMSDVGNYLDYLRIFGDLSVLLILIFAGEGRRVVDYAGFRVVFAFLCFYKWLTLLSSLKPFRAVGPHILPILEAMRGVGAFLVVLMFYMIGLWHSYITLEPGRLKSFDVWYTIYRIGLSGDDSQFSISKAYPDVSYYIVRVFYMFMTLLVTITLLNVFIAALGNEFNTASDNVETIFEQGRATTILSHMAVRAGIKRMVPSSSKRLSQLGFVPPETLWFCLSAERPE